MQCWQFIISYSTCKLMQFSLTFDDCHMIIIIYDHMVIIMWSYMIIWWSSYHPGRAHWCNYPPIEMHTLSSLSWLACVHLSDEKPSDKNAFWNRWWRGHGENDLIGKISLSWVACVHLFDENASEANEDEDTMRMISLRMVKYHSEIGNRCQLYKQERFLDLY